MFTNIEDGFVHNPFQRFLLGLSNKYAKMEKSCYEDFVYPLWNNSHEWFYKSSLRSYDDTNITWFETWKQKLNPFHLDKLRTMYDADSRHLFMSLNLQRQGEGFAHFGPVM